MHKAALGNGDDSWSPEYRAWLSENLPHYQRKTDWERGVDPKYLLPSPTGAPVPSVPLPTVTLPPPGSRPLVPPRSTAIPTLSDPRVAAPSLDYKDKIAAIPDKAKGWWGERTDLEKGMVVVGGLAVFGVVVYAIAS